MVASPCVITLGNFDGVHLGHRALLDAARRLGRGPVVALCFRRHPATVLRPEHAPPALTDETQRRAALLEAGAERVEWLEPTAPLLALEPEAFVDRVLEDHGPRAWVEGPDFRFGRDRRGDVTLLRDLGTRRGFSVKVIEPVEVRLTDQTLVTVRSTFIRWLIAHGRVADAARCLGRPYAVRGTVRRGERRGRAIGFPTVNLDAGDQLLPADGVYAGAVEVDGRTMLAAISVGTKPTFGDRPRTFEAYLLDFDGDLYDRTLEVEVARWVRDQRAFDGVESLVAQMHRDVERVREWHAAVEAR